VSAVRGMVSVGMVVTIAVMIGVWLSVESRAQVPDRPSIAGAWTLNRDLSDRPADRADDRDADDRGRRGGGYGRGGGFGRGGGGLGRGGYGRGGGVPGDPEEVARVRDAMRDIMNPPDHLVITDTGSMIVVTGPDGRTIRLSPDNRKVKDENTKIERKTRWDEGRLVSEISGVGRGKITETYAIDRDLHQLRLTVQMEGGRSGQGRTLTHVYDADVK
jgi:hypothetical protein